MTGITPTQKFVESLRTIRKSRGMTQQDVSDVTGLSRAILANIETRMASVSLDQAVAISSALGFSLELMIDGTAPHYDGLPEIVADLVDRLDAITGRTNDDD